MYKDEPLFSWQKWWLTVVCFLIVAVTVVVCVWIAAEHGAWR